MRLRGIFLLVLAVMVGGMAAYLARGWIQSQVPEQVIITEDKVPLTTVVVARRDLFFGDRLAENFLEERAWPSDTIPKGAFNTVDDLLAVERVVIRRIAANEPILPNKITGEGGRASLSAQITESMRAVTIPVNDILGVAGFVLPGDRVDLLLTREVSRNRPVTNILLQNIKILGIDQNANEEEDGTQVGRAATIEVTPEQAQKVVLATTVGSLSLALRNFIDVDPALHRIVTLSDLGTGEINTSPNAVARGLNGEGGAGAGGNIATLLEDEEARQETISRKLTGGNAGLQVTVTRGLNSVSYKVEQAGPSGSNGTSLNTPESPNLPSGPAGSSGPTFITPGGVDASKLPGTVSVPGG